MSLVATLFDAADAPALRQQVAELQATVTRLTAEVARLERENERLAADAKFHFEGFVAAQLRVAERTWGIG